MDSRKKSCHSIQYKQLRGVLFSFMVMFWIRWNTSSCRSILTEVLQRGNYWKSTVNFWAVPYVPGDRIHILNPMSTIVHNWSQRNPECRDFFYLFIYFYTQKKNLSTSLKSLCVCNKPVSTEFSHVAFFSVPPNLHATSPLAQMHMTSSLNTSANILPGPQPLINIIIVVLYHYRHSFWWRSLLLSVGNNNSHNLDNPLDSSPSKYLAV